MPNYYTPLPGAEIKNALIDYAPINNGLETLRDQRNTNRNALMQQRQLDNADKRLTMDQEAHAQNMKTSGLDYQTKLAQRSAGVAQMIQAEKDPARKAQLTQRMYAMHPDYKNNLISAGVDPNDHDGVANFVIAQARGYVDPLEQQTKQAQLGLIKAQTNAANQRGDGDFTKRAAAAQAFGLDPASDAGRSYILTGKLPREDQQTLTATDKKAILEADENVGVNRAGIQAIDQAKQLSPKANSGWGANIRAQIGANLPDMMVPDFISSPESSTATLDFDNAVVGQALGQLKATFGGNPTEGERKILLDLQGASGKPAAVRNEILQRARIAAENRLRLNEQRAQELRGGQFYKPGGGSAASNPLSYDSGAGDPVAEAKAAIAKGADPQKVMQRLQQLGIDPRGVR